MHRRGRRGQLGGNGAAEAKVSDVTVTGSVQVSGWWYVGGILGKGYSSITRCAVLPAAVLCVLAAAAVAAVVLNLLRRRAGGSG